MEFNKLNNMTKDLPTTYYSESKKEEVKISEMNSFHLISTLCKVAKENEGPNLLSALKIEVGNRLEAK